MYAYYIIHQNISTCNSSDYFKGLRAFTGKLSRQPKTSALVYAGAEWQKRNDLTVWRAADVTMMMEDIRSVTTHALVR